MSKRISAVPVLAVILTATTALLVLCVALGPKGHAADPNVKRLFPLLMPPPRPISRAFDNHLLQLERGLPKLPAPLQNPDWQQRPPRIGSPQGLPNPPRPGQEAGLAPSQRRQGMNRAGPYGIPGNPRTTGITPPALPRQPRVDALWSGIDLPVGAAIQARINKDVQAVLQKMQAAHDPNDATPWEDPNGASWPDPVERTVAGNQMALGLWQMKRQEEALRWFQKSLPEADRIGMGDWMRLNLALVLIDKGDKEQAANLLRPIVDRDMSEPDREYEQGLHFLAVGLLGHLLEMHKDIAQATQIYTEATERGQRLMKHAQESAWPGLYTGMTYVWRLHALYQEGMRQLPAALRLQKEFLDTVPLNRWTWREHQYVQDVVRQMEAASRQAAAGTARYAGAPGGVGAAPDTAGQKQTGEIVNGE
jgi:tetratricopeptide (TPR) repeat protein